VILLKSPTSPPGGDGEYVATKTRQRAPHVKRKIYFYRANVGSTESGRPLPFQAKRALRHISGLSYVTGEAYCDWKQGNVTCCAIDQEETPAHIRLFNIRREGLPEVERAGQFAALPIPADAGLAEQTHIVLFEKNIVGCEFNFYGPRLSRFAHFLLDKSPHFVPTIQFDGLLNPDIGDQVARLEDVRLFHFKADAAYGQVLAKRDASLFGTFDAAESAGDPEDIEIILRRPKKVNWVLNHVKRALQLVESDEFKHGVSIFSVRGYDPETERVETVDLLNGQIVATKRMLVVDRRTRAVVSTSAYDAIHSAYDELRHLIDRAPSIRRT